MTANDTAAVDAAYAAALQAGGQDDGAPSARHFGESYYAANVIDFDGNRLEFVRKSWNPESR